MPSQLDDKVNFILSTFRPGTLDVPEEESAFELMHKLLMQLGERR